MKYFVDIEMKSKVMASIVLDGNPNDIDTKIDNIVNELRDEGAEDVKVVSVRPSAMEDYEEGAYVALN